MRESRKRFRECDRYQKESACVKGRAERESKKEQRAGVVETEA